jgi:hypothetical protein
MKIEVTLGTHAGELDRRVLTLDDTDDMAEISNAIHEAMEDWILSVGDVIAIRNSRS